MNPADLHTCEVIDVAVVVAVNERGGAVALADGPQARSAAAGHDVRRSDWDREVQSLTD